MGKYKTGRIRDANSQRIIAAAEEEFALHGYKGARIQAIADRAGLPKANVHYYFATKARLYFAVLENMIELWNEFLDEFTAEDDPAVALELLIRRKVELARTHPRASKLFALEIIQGAPHIRPYLEDELRDWVREKVAVIEAWVQQGKILPVNPYHLIFLIWSSTQHYADFETQVLTIMDHQRFTDDMIREISAFLSQVIVRGVGATHERSLRSAPPKRASRRAGT